VHLYAVECICGPLLAPRSRFVWLPASRNKKLVWRVTLTGRTLIDLAPKFWPKRDPVARQPPFSDWPCKCPQPETVFGAGKNTLTQRRTQSLAGHSAHSSPALDEVQHTSTHSPMQFSMQFSMQSNAAQCQTFAPKPQNKVAKIYECSSAASRPLLVLRAASRRCAKGAPKLSHRPSPIGPQP